MSAVIYKDRIDALQCVDFFKNFDEDCLNYVARHMRVRTYAQGQVIFQQGDPCSSFYILLTGCVNVYFCSEEGREVIVSELQAGDVIGEVELLSNCSRLTNGIAAQTTRLLALDKSAFEYLLAVPAFSGAFAAAISRRLHQVITFAEGLSIFSLETRLARLLVSMSLTYGKYVSDGILIDRTISQTRIGQLINASRPKINAQLQAWQYENLIRVRKNQITILDRQSLQNLSRQQVYAS